MARNDPPDLMALLDDWCKSFESGDPDRIVALYDHKATIAYSHDRLQGRDELEDTVRSLRHKLQSIQVVSAIVQHASAQRLRFMVTLTGRFGRLTVENDWTVQDGRIRDHSIHLVVRKRSEPTEPAKPRPTRRRPDALPAA